MTRRSGFNKKPSLTKKVKVGWGRLGKPTKFSSRASRNVEDVAVVLEKCGLGNIFFITLTLPGSTQAAMVTFAEWIGYSTNRFNECIRRSISRPKYLWVRELQNRGALHLHYALLIPSECRDAFTEDKIRSDWYKILLSISKKAHMDVFEKDNNRGSWVENPEKLIVELQPCRWSVSAYMAKYHSKDVREFINQQTWSPGRWWGSSDYIRQEVKRQFYSKVVKVDSLDQADRLITSIVTYLQPHLTKIVDLKNPVYGDIVGKIGWMKPFRVDYANDILKRIIDPML